MTPQPEIIAAYNNRCGEGPVWDADRNRLIWDDMNASLIFEYDRASGAKRLIGHGLNAAGMALNRDGSLVLAGTEGLHLWRGPGDHRLLVAQHDGEPLNFNDILADRQGGLYAGTWYWGAVQYDKLGKLYRIDSGGAVSVMDEGIEMSNGLGLSPDDRTLYCADSSARRIYAYDVNPISGALSNKRVFVQVPGDEGMPDGLTVDAAGFVWSAQWYGAQVVRYDPDGKVERRIALPVGQVASLCFGGPELNELYITTAGEAWTTDYAPPGYASSGIRPGGELYRLRLDIQGRLEHKTNFVF